MIGSALLLVLRPPIRVVAPGEVGVRINRLTGGVSVLSEGPAIVLPLLQELRRYPLRDQIYKPTASASAEGAAPFQTVEGLSVGVSVAVRYALDRDRVADIAKRLPANVGQELIEPVVDGVLHRSLAKHTVREIFTDKRVEIQDDIEQELRGAAGEGRRRAARRCSSATSICRRSTARASRACSPRSWRREKMRFTLQLREKQVKEKSLEADAAKIQREKAAEAAASEEIIAAKAREEAMKHVLPLKEKEIEQRRLEAEARKVQQMKDAEGDAEARKIETDRRGGLAAQAVRRRRVPHRGHGQGAERADGARLGADRRRTRC